MRHLIIAAHPNSAGVDMVQHLYLSGIDPGMSRADAEKGLASVRRFVRRTF